MDFEKIQRRFHGHGPVCTVNRVSNAESTAKEKAAQCKDFLFISFALGASE